MRLRRLEIENFRGVRSLDWRHIADTAALVGPGDSGKSTILDAIERVLSPKRNVAFDDTDFWSLDTNAPIVIRATIADLAPNFYRDSKFGLLLHGFDKDKGEAVRASGDDGEEHALVVELRVEASLEPAWSSLMRTAERILWPPATAKPSACFASAATSTSTIWSCASAVVPPFPSPHVVPSRRSSLAVESVL